MVNSGDQRPSLDSEQNPKVVVISEEDKIYVDDAVESIGQEGLDRQPFDELREFYRIPQHARRPEVKENEAVDIVSILLPNPEKEERKEARPKVRLFLFFCVSYNTLFIVEAFILGSGTNYKAS